MSHAFAAHAAVCNLYAAAVADNAFEFRAFVLAACAFPVPFRPENTLAEQTVLFRTIGTIIDRLGLANLAKRPASNIIRACQRNLYRTVIIYSIVNRLCHFMSNSS